MSKLKACLSRSLVFLGLSRAKKREAGSSMPGLQDWVNKWVRVNKSNIRFPDDDELDGQRHVKIRHVTSHPAPAAREQETSLDIHESIHRNSFSDAEIPSESSGALHDMILGRVSSKPNSSKPRSSYRRPPADDMSNSVTDNFYLNGYTNKQPKAKRFSSKLRRKESKKLLKLSRHGEAEELNRSLSSSIHSRKSNCEGKTRLQRTNSQSDLLKVRAVEIQQNRRLRVQHMQYQASYLARIEAFQQQNPDVISDSVGVPSEVDATISNGTYLYSRQSSNEHQCGSFSLASPNVSQSGWPQAPPPTPPQPIRPINPLLTGTSTIKPTVKSTSFLRRRNSVGRESVGTTSSSSSRGASRSRGSGGGTIASVAARMYLNHLASLENSVRLTPIIQGSPPGLDDALSGTSASVHPTCASPLFCEPCVSKDQQIQLLKQELARLKGSSQLSVSSTLDKAKPQDASFECCIDSTAMDPLNSATDAKTQNESFECCIDSNAIDPLNSITEAKTQNASFECCIDSAAIDPLNSVSEAKTQNASFDLCIDSAALDPLNSITEALHRHHQQLEQITEDRVSLKNCRIVYLHPFTKY